MPTVASYLALITSEHANKPKFAALVESLVQPLVDAQTFFEQLLTTFDIDTAIGVQLDAVGQWVGRSRNIDVPLAGIYFSFDTTGLGFDQGNWKGPFDPDTGLTALDDDTYRLLLKAKVIMNSWDGTIAVAAAALTELFGNNPNTIISIEDNQDMTMTVSVSGQVPAAIIISLLQGGYVPIVPEGVGVNYLITSVNTTALFGFDVENATIAGFDVGSWSGTPGVGPGPVQGFALVTFTANSATFSWIPPVVGTGPYTYQLQYQIGTGTGVWITAGAPTSNTEGTVSNLQPNTTYSFEVYGINSVGPGLPSNVITLTTAGGPPAQVTGLIITGSSATTISVSWNMVVGNSILYQLQYEPVGGTFTNFNGAISATSATITGLTLAQTYNIQVYAQNPFGAGPPSNVVTSGTAGATPGAVQNLAIAGIGQNDISLSWGQPITSNGPYTYVVQYAQNVTPINYQTFTGTVTVTSIGGSCDVTGLTASQSYLFTVFATNSAGNGPVSLPVTATTNTQAPVAPPTLTTSGITSSAVTLTWGAAIGASTYQPQYAQIGTTTFTNAGSPTASLTATVTGLTAGTSYNFRVYGISTTLVQGPPSPLAAAITTGTAPGQVTALSASGATNTTMNLSWTAPATGTGVPVYQVQYKLAASSSYTNFGTPISVTSVTVISLQAGQSYDFQVYAINDFGTGTASTPAVASTTGGTTSTVTWNASDKTTDLTLSNGNLTATAYTPPITTISAGTSTSSSLVINWTASNPSGFFGVRGTQSLTAGKVYLEFTLTDSSTDFAVGIASANWSMTTIGLGKDGNSLGIYPNSPVQSAYVNNVRLVTGGTDADVTGDTISLAVDFGAKLFWFSSQGMRSQFGSGAWNCLTSSNANPATGLGGISLSTLSPGAYFPAFGDLEASSSCTLNTGASSFVVGLPSGFSGWGGTGGAAVTPPGQVTGLVNGTMTASSAPLTWSVPASGSPVTAYQVQFRKTTTSIWYNGPLVGTQTNAVVTDLIGSFSYDFQVYAMNSAGTGPVSNTLTASTIAPANALLTYRGLNIEGSDLTQIAGVATAFPHANAVIIPVFCSTANQTSTDVTLTTTLATVTGWITSATAANFDVFLAIYMSCRDGSPIQTITPGPSLTAVATFMTNLQTVCAQVAQIGSQNHAIGMFTGVELQPWAGTANDTGPFNQLHVSQWQAIYAACKAQWPSGVISYAGLQTSLGFTIPNSAWSIDWSIWDVIAIDLSPGTNNTYETTALIQTYLDNDADPDPETVSSVGNTPLIGALVTYSNSVGRKFIVNQCGIIPADGNQIAPNKPNVLPPPFDFTMQSAWWQAIMNELTNHVANFSGFFAWDGGMNGFNSPYSGIDYWGLQTTPSNSVVDLGFNGLTGIATSLTAPTNLTVTGQTTTSISVSWTGVAGSGITYVVQYSVAGASTFISLPATSSTSTTISNLSQATQYDIQVYAQQGTNIGPTSAQIVGNTSGSTATSITITQPATQTAGTAFTVKGVLAGYVTPPTLSYVDDGSLSAVTGVTDTISSNSITLNWGSVSDPTINPFPSGSTITTTAFSFLHPGLAAGTHKLIVTDGSINASATYTVNTATQSQTITVNTPSGVNAGQAFTLSGTLAGYTAAPTLGYADDNGAFNTITSGTTANSFSFNHPGIATGGSHTTVVHDNSNTAVSGSTTYSVAATTMVINVNTPSNVILNTPFTMSGTMTGYTSVPTLTYSDFGGASGTVNTTSGATVTSTTFSFTHPGITFGSSVTTSIVDAADNVSGFTTYNVGTQKSITITTPFAQSGSPFTISGTLSGYTSAPTLTYADDGGTAVSIPSAGVTTTTFTFSHPSFASPGAHTTVIKDAADNVTGSTSYTVQAPNTQVVSAANLILPLNPDFGIPGTNAYVGINWNDLTLAGATITYNVQYSTSATGPWIVPAYNYTTGHGLATTQGTLEPTCNGIHGLLRTWAGPGPSFYARIQTITNGIPGQFSAVFGPVSNFGEESNITNWSSRSVTTGELDIQWDDIYPGSGTVPAAWTAESAPSGGSQAGQAFAITYEIQIGTSPTALSTTQTVSTGFGVGSTNWVKVTGLTSAQQYYFQVVVLGSPLTEFSSASGSLLTNGEVPVQPVLSGAAGPITIA